MMNLTQIRLLFFSTVMALGLLLFFGSVHTGIRPARIGWMNNAQAKATNSSESLAYMTFLASTSANLSDPDITHDVYFEAVRILGYQLLHHPTTRTQRNIPFVVLVTEEVPDTKRDQLERDGVTVIPVEYLIGGAWMKGSDPRWKDLLTKLRAFELVQYSRILFIDGDTIVNRCLDGIFDDPAAQFRQVVVGALKEDESVTISVMEDTPALALSVPDVPIVDASVPDVSVSGLLGVSAPITPVVDLPVPDMTTSDLLGATVPIIPDSPEPVAPDTDGLYSVIPSSDANPVVETDEGFSVATANTLTLDLPGSSGESPPIRRSLSLAAAEAALKSHYALASLPETKPGHQFPPTVFDFRDTNYLTAGFFLFSPSIELFNYYRALSEEPGHFDSSFMEQNLLNYAHRRTGRVPWQQLHKPWNINFPTMDDLADGVGSMHEKWWTEGVPIELQNHMVNIRWEMELFYEGRDLGLVV